MDRMTLRRKLPQSVRPTLIAKVSLWLSDGKLIDGVWVGSYNQDELNEALSRVERALGLIKAFDPHRYIQIIRDLDRIWVRPLTSGIAHFDDTLRACVLDASFVLAETTEPEIIAAVIVHEATHARLWRCGIGYEEALRARVEAICVRREIAFANKLPDGQTVRQWAQHTLDNPPDLMDADFKWRELKGTIRRLRQLGVPSFIVRLGLAIRLRREARVRSRITE